jgi:hypothetical protein
VWPFIERQYDECRNALSVAGLLAMLKLRFSCSFSPSWMLNKLAAGFVLFSEMAEEEK